MENIETITKNISEKETQDLSTKAEKHVESLFHKWLSLPKSQKLLEEEMCKVDPNLAEQYSDMLQSEICDLTDSISKTSNSDVSDEYKEGRECRPASPIRAKKHLKLRIIFLIRKSSWINNRSVIISTKGFWD
jgi:hypothetical protein